MRLTHKLLGFLHRVFDRDPKQFLAFRLSYAGGMVWSVRDGILRTQVVGGPGTALTFNLADYTVSQLVAELALQPGYTVLNGDRSDLGNLSATVLLDGQGDISASNGDHLYGYTSFLFAYLEAQAIELESAKREMRHMLEQMSVTTAGDEWLDEWGSYLAVPRIMGEPDSQYAPRIIAEVLRPRGNNVAIEMAISSYTGQATQVIDVTDYGGRTPAYNGVASFNGTSHYDTVAVPSYGRFDVHYGYDLGLDREDPETLAGFRDTVRALVERMRDAGMHMRALDLTGTVLADIAVSPVDDANPVALAGSMTINDTPDAPVDAWAAGLAFAPLTDTPDAATDIATLTIQTHIVYAGLRHYNAAITYRGGLSDTPVWS